MGIIAKETMKNGTKLKTDNLTFAFPKKGIPVEEFDKILGKKLIKNVKKNQPLKNIILNDFKVKKPFYKNLDIKKKIFLKKKSYL